VHARELTNITIYRLTPKNYTGVTNMDTGDAAGDVMFGLNQLLLPQLCPANPDFTWCANRQYLSDGTAKMVYTEFVVEADARMGDYNACNPSSKTGIFECQTWSANAGTPRACAAGFEMFHEDCLNGTVLESFETKTCSVSEAEGACCAACTKAGAHCGGWNLMPKSNKGTYTCQVLAADDNLKEWSGAQATVGCKAANADPNSYACWYADPHYNTSFAGDCDPEKCTCDAISNRTVGYEPHAMCWNHKQQLKAGFAGLQLAEHHSKWFGYVGELGCLMDGNWYSTQKAGQCSGKVVDVNCWWRLAETHRTVNSTCVDDRIVAAVQKRRPECWEVCPQPTNRSSACYLSCLFETMLGNATQGLKPMTKIELVEPFVTAFRAPVHEGGCPAVH